MKKLYPLPLLIPMLFSCVTMNQYTYVTTSDIPLYGPKGINDVRYEDIPAGDTVITYGEYAFIVKAVYYKSTPVFTIGVWPESKLISEKRVYRKRAKEILQTRIPDSYTGLFASYNKDPEWTSEFPETNNNTPSSNYTPTGGSSIHTGPRGSRYYFNSNGNKTYIKQITTSPSRSRPSSSYRRR